ncbi:hypothetical protein ACJIZ3_006709 [Penstemon smallii]|uniref:HECT-type E3 ubiquitin transferase n=1 Tax=Penstemon smallii TaxID=265156 RepID=A0ABD3S8G4_9LAMI
MENDDIALSSPRSPPSDPTQVQFFVRMITEPTLVIIASSTDTIQSIHEKVQSSTGMPITEQRLIYSGKQLRWEQTLYECGVQNDAIMHLAGRMRSTCHPKAWQLMNDVVFLIFYLYKNYPPFLPVLPLKTVKSMLLQFLSLTPQSDPDQAYGHLQIFTASSAPARLVMLYMSSYRNAAADAIRHFFCASKTVLNKDTYNRCGPIALEFCKRLFRAVGTYDPLYVFCRRSLASMLELTDPLEKKALIGFKDIFPFVKELAVKLSHDLLLSTESTPSLSDVRDFSVFLVLVRKEIERYIVNCGPIVLSFRGEISGLPMCYSEEIKYLHEVFVALLCRLDTCLMKIDVHVADVMKQDGKTLIGCSQYLAILKELNLISKLYHGCEKMFWETMKRRTVALGNLIVKYVKKSNEHKWILDEGKEATNFKARRHLAMLLLPEVKYDYEAAHEMLIDRPNLLAVSFEYIAHADPNSLRAGLFMEFKNEDATGPGVLREWFFLVCQAIFNPQNALFVACPTDRRRFFPNPDSKVDSLHLEYFIFSGRMIALALMHKVHVGIVFDRVFFLQLAGHNITLEDIQDADPYFYSSCKQILEMDPEVVDQDVLALTFVHETEELGKRKIVELCPGGRSMIVNSKNRKQYVESLIQHRFVTSIGEQVAHFVQGFADIVSSQRLQRSFFHCLEPKDLDWMLHGTENAISVDDWKAHTKYRGFKKTDSQISWFWKAVDGMTTEQRKVLLFFWTSVKYLPIEGFGGLASRLRIIKCSMSFDRLPSSHTCFYELCLPAYPSLTVTCDRLRIITQEHVGCSFGTS